jgi:hypothetical protein
MLSFYRFPGTTSIELFAEVLVFVEPEMTVLRLAQASATFADNEAAGDCIDEFSLLASATCDEV